MNPKKKSSSNKTELWAELLEHISNTWSRKKGRKYLFTGQDLKLIKQLRGWLTAPEVMALWEIYLDSSPFWGPKTGWLLSGFWSERSVLLDHERFKSLTRKHEAALGMKEPKEVALELGL